MNDMSLMDAYTSQIVQTVKETEDKFIFQSVLPFCNEITQRELSKKDLVNALVRYRELEEENRELKNRLHKINKMLDEMQSLIKENYYGS